MGIKKVVSTERIPIKLWLDDIEDGALEQAKNLANLPFAFKHVSIMPDSHQGYGMPIGGVLATHGAIIPNAVGVDIGCGMCALRTDLRELDTDTLKRIMGTIRETVPVGRNHHKEKQSEAWMPETSTRERPIVSEQYERSMYQLGTLGGGNHFIEIQKGSDGYIWIMIHSGSRNVGYTVAKYYNDLAKEICNRWYSSVPDDLAFFPLDSDEFDSYMMEMNWCIDFALSNRKLMMERVKTAFMEEVTVDFEWFINKPHNFAQLEHHFGKNVIVHRKGACQAREGEYGMIPSSQGSTSYIVKGKGNEQSFESCSHGAGRLMSRTKARNTLSVEEETKRLDDMGVLHAIRSKNDLDEAPSSYKDIDVVMSNQTDLVDIEVELTPLGVIKG